MRKHGSPMAHCTTFDLLLVDWLYDELEPAEAARFTRHIDGCDACWRTAEAMTRIRALMRELPEQPPPEAISSRILRQAAEQVAGTRKRGLLSWLAGSLETVWAHPAAAALASMVLIAGVAGVLFTRGKLEMAAPTASPSAEGAQLEASDAPAISRERALGAAPPAPAQEVAQSSEKLAAALGEAEEQRNGASRTRGEARPDGVAAEPGRSDRVDTPESRPAPDLRRAKATELRMATESDPTQEWQSGLTDDEAGARAGSVANVGAGRVAGPAPETTASTPARAPAATPGDAAGVAPGTASAATPRSTPNGKDYGKGEGKDEDKAEDNSAGEAQPRQQARKRDERTWAESMNDALRAALRQAECARAVQIAEDIRAREPGYYRTVISNSKELAACRQRQPAEPQGQADKGRTSGAD
jgi:anti-sigma factor RsiW